MPLFNLYPTEDNPFSALHAFAKALHLPIAQGSLYEHLHSHPDYPSLFSMAETLKYFEVEQASLQLKPEQLKDLEAPFIAHLKDKNCQIEPVEVGVSGRGEFFVTVTQLTPTHVSYTDGQKKHTMSHEEFLEKWTGVVLLAEGTPNSGEADYAKKHRAEQMEYLRLPLIIGLLVAGLAYTVFLSSTWQVAILLLLFAIGTIFCILILQVQYGKSSAFTNTLCNLSSKTGCTHLLHSPAAQITQGLGWGELGLFYFVGSWFYLTLTISTGEGTETPHHSSLIAHHFLAFGGLVFSFWSVYYQGWIAKKWCPLCLGVLVVIILENAILFNLPVQWAMPSVGALATFLVAPMFWYALKPLLIKARQAETYQQDLRKFKNKPEVFEILLRQQPQMPPVIPSIQPMILGNDEATLTITMVTNPFCEPCASTHKALKKLLASKENLNCQVIFLASNDKEDKRGTVARSILALAKEKQAEALTEWYENKSKSVEGIEIAENKEASKILEQHQIWCEAAQIEATPTLYFNGFKIPEMYRVEDLGRVI